MVHTRVVCQEVSVHNHLGDNWPVLDNFTLNANIVGSEAVVDNFVELIVQAAFICVEMFLRNALSLLPSVWIASLRDEALAFTPAESACDVATLAPVVTLITANNLLCRELNWSFGLLADAVLHNRDCSYGVAGRAVALVDCLLHAVGVGLAPVVGLGHDGLGLVFLGLAGGEVGRVGQRVAEEGLHIGDCPVLRRKMLARQVGAV
jgi:hypothetical protein